LGQALLLSVQQEKARQTILKVFRNTVKNVVFLECDQTTGSGEGSKQSLACCQRPGADRFRQYGQLRPFFSVKATYAFASKNKKKYSLI
jgi:hypothetical protein